MPNAKRKYHPIQSFVYITGAILVITFALLEIFHVIDWGVIALLFTNATVILFEFLWRQTSLFNKQKAQLEVNE